MNSLQKLASMKSFHGYIIDTGKKDADTKRKKLKEQGFTKVDRDQYLKERKGPLNTRFNEAKGEVAKVPGKGSVAGGVLGAGLGFISSTGAAKSMAGRSLAGLAGGAALGGLAGLGAARKMNKKIDKKKEMYDNRMNAVIDAKLLSQKGDPEFYMKTAGFKEASVASKFFKAFPNSKTLERITTRQVVKAQQKGNTARRNVIRGDMDAVQSARKTKARGPETGLAKVDNAEKGLMETPKPNVGSDKVPSSAFGLDALKNRKRDMYMLAGGAALGGGTGYALGNSNSE